MSRIGNKVITIPEGVKVEVSNGVCLVKGPKGEDKIPFDVSIINVEVDGNEVKVTRKNDEKRVKQMHGTIRALINNACKGVHEEFKKTLYIIGIGYKAEMKGKDIVMYVGYSHTITISPLPGVTIETSQSKKKDVTTEIVVRGSDKFAVGQTAALIRDTRRPEPYQGKGVRYADEFVPHKEGKRAGGK